uniref:Aspartate--tRNA ligase n=1 Tax=Schistocephalus solidus TaxID=70667 RepID=A0A0X3NYJ9_SCHSO
MFLSVFRRHASRTLRICSSARSILSTYTTENNLRNLKTSQRTHTCGELRKRDVGKFVTLCGWLYSTRLSCAFLLIKDAYGITQVLVDKSFRKRVPPSDSVIKVEGNVRLRPEKDINPAMPTGFIEVQANNIEVLGPVLADIPFFMKDITPINEHLGLKYRYLHLRRPEFQRNLRFRSTFLLMLRKYLCEKEGFVDLETPCLFRRTPGGAKEFIVPSQIRGQFYSLPQSPQQFKQLLMVGGFDRYMQIARCFRDELARPDRQPEFTQLDIEASFVEKEDIYRIIESTLSYAWSALQEFQLEYSPLSIPFQRMSYDEAMHRFGTDKPDTRFELELWDIEGSAICPHMVCLTVPSLYVDELTESFTQRLRQEIKEKTGQEVSMLLRKELASKSMQLQDSLAHVNDDELVLFVEGNSTVKV